MIVAFTFTNAVDSLASDEDVDGTKLVGAEVSRGDDFARTTLWVRACDVAQAKQFVDQFAPSVGLSLNGLRWRVVTWH